MWSLGFGKSAVRPDLYGVYTSVSDVGGITISTIPAVSFGRS